MLISLDFRKSMHGFAMDSRTRDRKKENYKYHTYYSHTLYEVVSLGQESFC